MIRYPEICPFTGLAITGRSKFGPYAGRPREGTSHALYLYEFAPVGRALVDSIMFLSRSLGVQDGYHIPNTILAGICREAHELKKDLPIVTAQMFDELPEPFPRTFEDKRMHLLRLLYEAGGQEYIKRHIYTRDDFPLGFAENAAQFHRMLESLIDERLLRYNKSYTVHGDYEDRLLAHYHEVLLTPSGRQLVSSMNNPRPTAPMPTNSFSLGSHSTVNLVQGDNINQTNVSGNNSTANVVSGHHNTQASQIASPASIKELVEQLRPLLQDVAFESYREEIDHELERIEVQLNKPEPKKSIIETAFGYVKDMAVKSAGPAAASGVIELIKHAPALLATIQDLG